MKILIAADIFPPESGGPATYSAALANELMKMGDEVWVISLNYDGEKKLPNTYHVTRRKKVFKYMEYFWLLLKFSKNVDVIYSMGPVNAGLPALLVAKSRRKRMFVKVVGDYAWEQWQNQISKLNIQNKQEFVKPDDFINTKVNFKIRILRFIERLVTRNVNKIIVPSQYLKEIVNGWGVNPNKIEVVYNAVEFKTAEPIKHGGERWMVSVGRLVSWKGFGTLIEIMPRLLEELPDLRLKIIGTGHELRKLKDKVQKMNLRNSVELVGDMPKEETLSYINSADLFILNTGYEGLSHVILEALYCGVPILASDSGGNPELLRKENLFNYNNKEQITNKILSALKKYDVPVLDKSALYKFKFETMIKDTRKILCGN